jgi:hypothetical protein
VQNTEAQNMSNEGILDEGLEIEIHVADGIDASSENDSGSCTGDEADDSGKTSGLPSIPVIAPLSIDRDKDTWLT